MQKSIVKNAHIIPQTYLKQFLAKPLHNPNEKSVFVAYKNNFNIWTRTGIKNKPFAEKYFYDFSAITEKSQTIETFLSQKIENKYQHLVTKITNEEMLYDEDLTNLFRFVISMYFRTKKMQKILQEPMNTLKVYAKDFETENNKIIFQNFFSASADYSKMWLLGVDEILNKSTFYKKSVFIIRNNTDIPFIASDNPVDKDIIGKYEIEQGFGLPYFNNDLKNRPSFFFPLTPKILLLYCDYIDYSLLKSHSLKVNDANIVLRLNYFQLRNCDSFIISNRDDVNIDYKKFYEETLKRFYNKRCP